MFQRNIMLLNKELKMYVIKKVEKIYIFKKCFIKTYNK